MKVLHLFSGTNTITAAAEKYNFEVVSVDMKYYKNYSKPTFQCDVLDFDYNKFCPGHFDLIIIGFPCNCFSKVGRFQHFDEFWNSKTTIASSQIYLLNRIISIIQYFKNSIFILENPTGAIGNFPYFRLNFLPLCEQVVRIHQKDFGHIVAKQTDLFTNSKKLILVNRQYRVNKKYQINRLDNLSYQKKVSYPVHFCDFLIHNFI